MNKIFKRIWNKSRGSFVAVSEAAGMGQARGSQKVDGLKLALVSTAVISALMLGTPAHAYRYHLPGGTINHGVGAVEGESRLYWDGNINITASGTLMTFICGHVNSTLPGLVDVSGKLNLGRWNNGGMYYLNGSNQIVIRAGGGVYNGEYNSVISSLITDTYKNMRYSAARGWGGLTMSGSAKITNDGEFHNNAYLYIQGGTFVNNASLLNDKEDGVINLSSGSITGNGLIQNDYTANFTGGSVSAATLSGNGTANLSGSTVKITTASVRTLNVNSGSITITNLGSTIINNALNLSVNALTKKSGVTYTQSAGSLTVSNGDWFAGSTLNINGGSLNHASLGSNTYNLSAGTVTGNFTDSTRFNLKSGTLNTGYASFFTPSSSAPDTLNVIDLNATATQSVKGIDTDHFLKYIKGSLVSGIGNRVTLSGGSIVITDSHLSDTQIADLTAAFRAQFGNTVSLTFKNGTGGISRNDSLTTAKVNELQTAGVGLDAPIFVDRTFDAANGQAVFGNSGVKNSVGFVGISDATGISVADGKKLVLIGKNETTPFAMATVATTVGAKSTLELGSLGLSGIYRGKLSGLTIEGGNTESSRAQFSTVKGVYSTGAVTAKNAAIFVKSDGYLTMDSLAFAEDDSLRIDGTLTVKGNLTSASDAMAVLDNFGELTVEGDTTLNGSLTNHSNAYASLRKTSVNGTLTNAANAYLEANDLTVRGQLVNFGQIEASDTSSVFGVLTNNGTIRLYDTEVGNRGSINNTYTLTHTGTLTVNGKLSNAKGAQANFGTIAVGDQASLTNRGSMIVEAINGSAGTMNVTNAGKLTVDAVTAEGSAVLDNAGTLITSDISSTGGLLSLKNSGTLTAEAVSAAAAGSAIENSGTLRVNDITFNADNTVVTNTGDLTSDNLLLKGASAVDNRKTMTVGDITIDNAVLTLLNAGTLTASMVSGLAEGSSLTNSGTFTVTSLALSSDNSALSNFGTFNADLLNVSAGASVTNGTIPVGRIAVYAASGATQIVHEFNLSEGATATNAGTDYFGKGTISGTYTIASSGTSYLGYSSEHTDDVGYTIAATGKIVNDGRLSLGGTVANAGVISGNGTLTLLKGTDGTFTNTGSIQSGTLIADNVTYTQTAGTLAADAGWFTNSVINQTGGTITSVALGTGNTYNLGADGSTDSAQYNLGTLTSDSTVNIRQGATLHADAIAMTGNKTTHLLGGTLATTFDQIFNDVSHQAHDIDATGPNDRVDVAGPDIVTGVGTVIDSVAKGIEFGWGTVAFDDASYSAVVAADALAKLDALDADYAGKTLEVAFNGKADKEFNVDLANTVVATKNGSATFATFVNETLTNLTTANAGATSLVVGTDANLFVPESGTPNVLNDSMGFRSIVGVSDGVYVNDGRHLVLVGNEEGIDLADGKVVVGGANADGTASVLTLGSYASAKPTKGHLSEVWVDVLPSAADQGGATAVMQVRNGSFTVDSLHNGGILRIGGDGTDLAEDHTAELTVSQLYMVGAAKLINDGVLTGSTLTYANNTGNHEVRNRGQMTFSRFMLNGRLINSGTLKVTDTMNLMMRGSENSGTLEVNHLMIGPTTTWGSGGTARGRLVNTGTLTVSNLDVLGDFENEGEVDATLQISVGQTATFRNAKNITATYIQLNGSFTNEADGVLKLTQYDTWMVGNLNNAGTIDFSGDGIFRVMNNGQLTNTGSFTADSEVGVMGGTFVNQAEATLNDLTIRAGQLINESGSLVDRGTTTVNLSDKTAVGIENNAEIRFADLQLVSGVIEGGTIGTADSVGTVQADGTIRNADAVFKDLTNAGVVDVGKLTTKTTFTNSGTANLVTADVTGLVNETAGTLTVKDGTFTNAANHGTMTVTGTVAADGTNDGKLTVADSGRFNVDAGKTFESSGTLTSTGAVTSSGLLKLSGTSDLVRADMTSVGTIESSGTTQIGDLTFADNGHFKLSGGTTHVDRLQAVNAFYTQTDGTFKSDKGWFKDSTLNIEGGRLDAADTRNDDGSVNGTLGHNTVNISGLNTPPSFNNEDSVESKSHFADNLTVVRADTVTSDTVINLMAGGVLDVDHLDLTETGKFNLDGGILRTSLDQIYKWVKTQVIDIKAENPETGVIEIPTQVLASTTVGDVKSSIKDNLTMASGSIAFDDEFFSASTVLSSALQFAKAFGEDNAVTLHYLGQMQTPVTIDTVKELEDEGLSEVMAGIVLDTTTLHNENAVSGTTNRDLIIGGTADGANTINISIGFKDVANADKITVAGGKEFALVGSERAEDFDWTTGYTDATKFLTDAADGGHADAADGTFTFGSDGLANSTVGWVAASDIAEKGKLLVKNGEFADWTIKNDGTVEVRRNAILHTNDYSGSGEGLNAGTFDVNGTFDVGGTFVNDGFLTAVDTSVTNVIGSLVNTKDGKAEYADMVIAEGGTSANAGNEKGENLTVNGKHTNTGTSIWNTTTVSAGGSWANGGTASGTDMTVSGDYLNVGTAEWTNETVAAGGTAKNTGKETIAGTYDVAGTKTNSGEVDATGTETTRVSGTLTNEKEGKSFYDDMVIASGGSSVNHGYEKGDILTVEGEHTNTGTSLWNTIIAAVGGLFKNDSTLEADDLTVSGSFTNTGDAKLTGETVSAGGSARNEGKETISGTYDVAGDKTNVGEIDATATETTNVSGTLTNETEGNAKYDDMVIAAGGSSVNHGTEIGDILTVKGDHTNTGTSTWNNVGLEDGGHMTNSGTLTTDKLTQNGGVFEHTKGTFTAEDAELNGGDFVIGNHLELSEDNLALAKFPKATEINNRIWVIGNGHAAFGNTADGLGASISAPTLPDTPARVSVSETVTIGSGSLAVGTDTWTSETEKVTLGNGDLYFGSDSYTLVDASNFNATNAAFKSACDTGKLFVKAGATLILGHIPEVGDYLIADGFDTTENGTTDWIGGWNDTTLKALPDSPSGIGWDLKLNHDATKVWVTALYKDVRTVYPDIAIPDNVQDAMNNGGKTGDAADDFIRDTLNNRDLSVGDKTQQINSVAEIGAAGGVMEAFTGDLAAAQNSVFDRVSFTGEHFTREGQLLRDTHGGSLWADILGGQRESSDFTASGNMTSGHKTNAYGVVVGGDYVTAAADKTFGFAVAYSGDTVKSSGDWLATKNKSTSVTATAYADWAVSDKVNLVGTLSYLNGSAKVTQSLLPGFGEAAADVKTNLFSVAARAEYRYRVAGVNVIPHVGLSASFGKSGGYDISVAGEKAFEATPGNVMTFDLPVGVAVRGDYETASGWNLRASGDFTVTGHFGDREESTDITNARGVNDTVQAGFLGAWSSNLGLQLQVDKGPATVGLRLGASVGDAGKQDYSGSINVRYVF